MKSPLPFILLAALTAPLSGRLHAQGSLTPPPGAPAPTMKTLDQVEARTPIGTAPFTISQPGSYYLTGNLTVSSGNAINITASNVTLDLNGFTISSTAAVPGGSGVQLASGLKRVTIENGNILGTAAVDGNGNFSGGGFSSGIAGTGIAPYRMRVTKVRVAQCRGSAILAGSVSRVEDCQVDVVSGTAIQGGTILRCEVNDCQSGISGSLIKDCLVTTFSGTAIDGKMVHDSNGRCEGDGAGINASLSVHNCTAFSSSGTAIMVQYGQAESCRADSGLGIAIHATTATSCIASTSGGSHAILVSGTATGCRATRSGGTALSASIAIGCTSGGGTISSAQKHLGTP